MRRRVTQAAAMLGLGLAAVAQAEPIWVGLTSPNPSPPEVRVIADEPRSTVVHIAIPGYVADHTGGVAIWTLPGCSWAWEQGRPQVPRIALDLAIADEGDVSCEVLEQETRGVAVERYRAAEVTRRSPPRGTVQPAAVAPTPGGYPNAVAACGTPFILRRVRGVTLTVHPFQYDASAGWMQVTTSLVVRVRTSGAGGRNALQAASTGGEPDVFVDTYRRRFINFRARTVFFDPVPEVGRMLVIAHDSLYDATLPYVYWKRQKGIPTEIVATSQIGGTFTNLQAFIRNYYASNGVTYVQLVGDTNQVPSPPGTKGIMTTAPRAPADPRYVLLAGDDHYADAFIARFPGSTPAFISNMVQRCIRYERAPATNETWHHAACGVASTQLAGGVRDYERMELIRATLTNFTYTLVDQVYDPSATTTNLRALLNAGRSLVNYQGHGTAIAWASPVQSFTVNDVYNLANTNRLPFVYMVGCRSGQFHFPEGDCQAEAWIRSGTVAAPRGGVSVCASTHDQWVLPPTTGQGACMELLVTRQFQTLGALSFNAVMQAVSLHTETNPDPPGTMGEELYEQTHLLGDGTLVPWTDTPKAMVVFHAGVRHPEQGAYRVRVPGEPGALCALYDAATHTLLGAGYTDSNGAADVPVSLPGEAQLTLTVTAFNRVPYIARVVPVSGLMMRVQ